MRKAATFANDARRGPTPAAPAPDEARAAFGAAGRVLRLRRPDHRHQATAGASVPTTIGISFRRLTPTADVRSTLRRPPGRSNARLLRALRLLWTLPTNLVGFTAGVLVSGTTGTRIGSPAAQARLFIVRLRIFAWVKGITLGHAILLAPDFAEGTFGRLVLAHELAHTRQHDVLGPFYLPLHAIAQALSAAMWIVKPVHGSDPVHAHNPLEEKWLFMGHSAIAQLMRGERMSVEDRDRWLDSLGV